MEIMCNSPVLLYRKGQKMLDGRLAKMDISYPCNRCVKCKKRRVNDWVTRLSYEEKFSFTSYFVTLTYDESQVPYVVQKDGKVRLTLVKGHLMDFFKRLRKYQISTRKIYYYAVGEYGSKTNRPHYHAIILNCDSQNLVIRAWSNYMGNDSENKPIYKQIGQIHFGDVRPDSIAYTAKYIDKPKRIPQYEGDIREKEFSIMSKGIGKNYVLDEKMVRYHKQNIDNPYITRDGYKVSIPRYYKDRIFDEKEKEQIALSAKRQKEQNELEKIRVYNEENPGEKEFFTNLGENIVDQELKFAKRSSNRKL